MREARIGKAFRLLPVAGLSSSRLGRVDILPSNPKIQRFKIIRICNHRRRGIFGISRYHHYVIYLSRANWQMDNRFEGLASRYTI